MFPKQYIISGVKQLTPADHVSDPGVTLGGVEPDLRVDGLCIVLGSSGVATTWFSWKAKFYWDKINDEMNDWMFKNYNYDILNVSQL